MPISAQKKVMFGMKRKKTYALVEYNKKKWGNIKEKEDERKDLASAWSRSLDLSLLGISTFHCVSSVA